MLRNRSHQRAIMMDIANCVGSDLTQSLCLICSLGQFNNGLQPNSNKTVDTAASLSSANGNTLARYTPR